MTPATAVHPEEGEEGAVATFTQKRLAVWAVRLKVLGVLAAVSSVAEASQVQKVCHSGHLPVALWQGLPPSERVFAKLCLPAGETPSTVQLLVHGITYTHQYWDFPDPEGPSDRYSYVSAALNAGFATLAIDRIGSGDSSRPPGASVTLEANAYVVHQVVQALRTGWKTGPSSTVSFSKVILVGHSYGSFTAWYEASDYQDVDGVILSGVSHFVTMGSVMRVITPLVPAGLDPAFFGRGYYDPSYLTTRPQTRYSTFYFPGEVTRKVLERDEKTKSTVTLTEFAPFPLILTRPLDIRVPVLLFNGTEDRLFCGPSIQGADCSSAEALVATEGPRLGPQVPCIEGHVLQGAGHVLNTLGNAQEWFAVAQNWAVQRVGPDAGPAPGCGLWEAELLKQD
ncbi:Hydrolase, alpha/beta fold family protein [Stigmatella aurantiaca DW4/3-1]|uniref:Hydrolase, alpha/beta fold family protein n=1 Tax=Stigmatella aurantiaca (strain DW4/3-1) TaxID=378806 RepID=E3FWQ1_STIAD|nr:Hydrolase, alpha/beta fold family protein [Stigmatella aurantiaca DW4/3-1]